MITIVVLTEREDDEERDRLIFYVKFFPSYVYGILYFLLTRTEDLTSKSARIIIQHHSIVKVFTSKISLSTKISIFQVMLGFMEWKRGEFLNLPSFAGFLWRCWLKIERHFLSILNTKNNRNEQYPRRVGLLFCRGLL